MKKLPLSVALALAVPAVALAIDIAPGNFYPDVRESSPEAVGINLLSREGIVKGYANGSFGPTRQVNRAEFLKIAMLSAPQSRRPELVAADCFPDVHAEDWFSPYVCAAKEAGIVSGNADPKLPRDQWKFAPDTPVQYDAALKMLTLLFGYEIHSSNSADWAAPYYDAAAERGTDLPTRIRFDTLLTRAQAARLAGAFLADSYGKLAEYRMAESGEYVSSSSSSSSSVSSSESSSSSSSISSSSSSSSSAAALFTVPSVSHFLVVGQTSDALADGIIRSNGETAKVLRGEVKVFTEVRSIDRLEIVDGDGVVVMKLLRRVNTDISDYKLTFEAQVDPSIAYTLAQDKDVRFVLRAVVRDVNGGGFADELLQVRTFNVTMRGDTVHETVNKAFTGPFPKHQTSFGRIKSVTRVTPASAPLQRGSGVLVSTFAFSGSVVAGRSLSLTDLVFTLSKTGTITAKNWSLVRGNLTAPCSMNEAQTLVTCSPLKPSGIGAIPASGAFVLDLRADVATPPSTAASLRADLLTAGSPESLGSVLWTDESGMFKWVEGASPVVTGTYLQ